MFETMGKCFSLSIYLKSLLLRVLPRWNNSNKKKTTNRERERERERERDLEWNRAERLLTQLQMEKNRVRESKKSSH